MNIEKDKRYLFALALVAIWSAMTIYAMISNGEVPIVYQNTVSGIIGGLLGSAYQKSKSTT